MTLFEPFTEEYLLVYFIAKLMITHWKAVRGDAGAAGEAGGGAAGSRRRRRRGEGRSCTDQSRRRTHRSGTPANIMVEKVN